MIRWALTIEGAIGRRTRVVDWLQRFSNILKKMATICELDSILAENLSAYFMSLLSDTPSLTAVSQIVPFSAIRPVRRYVRPTNGG